MGDFDIEAYLEEQVDGKKLSSSSSTLNESILPKSDSRSLAPERSDKKSRSHDRDRKSRSRDKDSRRRLDRSRSDSREGKRRHRNSSRDRDRDRDQKKSKPESEEEIQRRKAREQQLEAELLMERDIAKKKREIDDLTKDQRTILVGQLTMKVNESDLRSFFTQIGKVNSVIMIRDKHTGRHKGIGYVEMADLEDIPNCLLFNNVVPDFQKFAILVKPSEAEKNFVAKKDPVTSAPSVKDGKSDPDARLYIGNIHVSITDMALRSVLEQFGQLETVALHRDELGNSKGFAFARFSKPESAKLAMSNLAGVELAGRPIKVGPVNDASNKSESTTSGNNSTAGTQIGLMDAHNNQSASHNWKLDDDDGVTGMQMNSQSRASLMQKLGQAAGMQIPQPPLPPSQPVTIPPPTVLPPAIIGNPSKYIMLRNMFVLEEETELNWHLEIKEDVIDECTKYGKVMKCDIETRRVGGMVYLHFDTIESAVKATTAMHGRYFAGRMITVNYLDAGQYTAFTS